MIIRTASESFRILSQTHKNALDKRVEYGKYVDIIHWFCFSIYVVIWMRTIVLHKKERDIGMKSMFLIIILLIKKARYITTGLIASVLEIKFYLPIF